MIIDDLIQLGKEFDQDKKDTKHATNRVTKYEPIVEKCMDNVGMLYTYSMEFYTYGDSFTVSLDIKIFPKFRNIIYG